MPKQGFKNQWVEICRVGEFVDASGKPVKVDDNFLNATIANFNATDHEPPIVIGHPKTDAPAFGWTQELRRNGDKLEARFADTNDEFEEMVVSGAFRKRSAAFYTNPPVLKHIGFLGAKPPAVKGLRNIQFSDGESVTVEILFNEEQIMEEKDVDKVADSVFDKIKNFFKSEEAKTADAPTANFSEADQEKLIEKIAAKVKDDAKKEAVAEFAEEMKTRDEQIKSLTDSINAQSASGKRSEIVAFVEAIPAEKGKHFLKKAGIMEFMESLADEDKADAISFSEGDTEHKFSRLEWFKNYVNAQKSFVEFGEKFGNIKTTADADLMLDEGSLDEMRGAMGMKKDGGDK